MAGERVWLLPRTIGDPDPHGEAEPSWPSGPGEPGAVAVDGAFVAPQTGLSGEAAIAGREAVIENLDIYLPPGSRVEATARVWVRDEVYEVIGEAGVWVQPWIGAERGVVVALRHREG